jgi:hypothetical protein
VSKTNSKNNNNMKHFYVTKKVLEYYALYDHFFENVKVSFL